MAPRARIQTQTVDSHEEHIDLDISSESESDIDGATKISTTQKALQKAQLEITDLREELRKQAISYNELEQRYKTLRIKSHKEKTESKGKESTSVNASDNDLIGIHARRFSVMNEMYVPKDIFLNPQPQGIYSDDPDRWDDDEKMKNCLIAELYEELPQPLHDMIEKSSSFRETFTTTHSAQRRFIIHQLRTKTAGLIFSKNQLLYRSDADRSLIFRDVIIEPGKKKFSKYAPILFPDMKVDAQKSGMFRNDSLPLMLRSILFGSMSLSGTKKPSTSTVGYLWGVKHVTPGAIAFVSVLAIYLHSVDDTFEPKGSKSLIEYNKLFSTYKQIIMKKLQDENDKFEETIKWYNSQVFDWFNSKKGRGGDSSSSGIDEVMNQLEDLDINSDAEGHAVDNEDRNSEQAQIHSASDGTQGPIPRPPASKTLAPSQPTPGPSNYSEHDGSQAPSQPTPGPSNYSERDGSQTQQHIVTVSNPIIVADTSDLEDDRDAGSALRPTRGRGRGPSKPVNAQGQTRRSSRKK